MGPSSHHLKSLEYHHPLQKSCLWKFKESLELIFHYNCGDFNNDVITGPVKAVHASAGRRGVIKWHWSTRNCAFNFNS